MLLFISGHLNLLLEDFYYHPKLFIKVFFPKHTAFSQGGALTITNFCVFLHFQQCFVTWCYFICPFRLASPHKAFLLAQPFIPVCPRSQQQLQHFTQNFATAPYLVSLPIWYCAPFYHLPLLYQTQFSVHTSARITEKYKSNHITLMHEFL